MKQMIQGFLLAGTLVLGGAALAQEGSKAQGKSPTTKGGTAEFHGFMAPTNEKDLLERIHHINQTEIKLGQLAQQNASNPDVKAYGEQMVRDHTAADQRVMSLAQGRGLKLAEPKPMNDVEKKAMAADKANMEKLQALKGEPFDSCYMANMVGDHDAALGKLMAGQQGITGNAELTTMLGDLSKTVAQHREHAYTLLGKVGPQAMGMGVGGAGGSESGMGGHMGTQPSGSGTQQPKK